MYKISKIPFSVLALIIFLGLYGAFVLLAQIYDLSYGVIPFLYILIIISLFICVYDLVLLFMSMKKGDMRETIWNIASIFLMIWIILFSGLFG